MDTGEAKSMDDQTTIGMIQINNSFSGQNYLPYSIALLQAYAEQNSDHPERYRFIPPIYKRMPISRAVESFDGVDIVGFSAYVWNFNISTSIARRLKERSPNTLIIFGGPHVPDHAQEFLTEHPYVDIAVHGEGERTFMRLLDAYPENHWQDIPGISFLDDAGRFVHTPPEPRIRELMEIPSPFLTGTLDQIIKENPDETWIGLWETNRGCPFSCSFCDWGSATAAKVGKFDIERLNKEVDWFARQRIEYIFCCDANFGIQKRDVDIAEYVAACKKSTGYPHALSVQNTKNATERAYLTQKILADAGLNKGVALSMQTVDMPTLENIGRKNIAIETYMELQRRFTNDGIETYSDLILGLPGETYETFAAGVEQLIESGQHNRIQFNNLSVLPNAEMGSPDYQKRHGMKLVETEIINIHGERIELDDDVAESQLLVVATNTTPEKDWLRTRAFSWMAAFLHFDKILQIPLILSHELTGVGYRTMIEAFLDSDANKYPRVSEIRNLFIGHAEIIQNGGPEYIFSEEWLGIYWPADEYAFIKLIDNDKMDEFYREAGEILRALAAEYAPAQDMTPINEALKLNQALIKRPFAEHNVIVKTTYDIMPFYTGVLHGKNIPLRKIEMAVEIVRDNNNWNNFQTWCREVVWWGNKKGAYLYGSRPVQKQLAGHY